MFKLFVPYYNEIKLAGHMACALVGAFAGGTFMFVFSLFLRNRADRFLGYFGVSLFAASILWILPATADPRSLPWELSATILMFAFYPFIKFALNLHWRQASILWFAFWLSQAIMFAAIYFHLA